MEIMEYLERFVAYVPPIVAALVLMIAVLIKTGKEKGSVMCTIGVIGLFLMSIGMPLFYQFVFPKIIAELSREDISRFYMLAHLTINIFWSAMIVLFAIGTFMRPAPGSGGGSYQVLPIGRESGSPPAF